MMSPTRRSDPWPALTPLLEHLTGPARGIKGHLGTGSTTVRRRTAARRHRRALVSRPAIVLADGPGNLDTKNSDAVLHMLRPPVASSTRRS